MKITMLGRSGSGKTTYMSALYDVLNENVKGPYHMEPSSDSFESTIYEVGRFAEISFLNLATDDEYKFPTGTVETTVWHFDLMYLDQLAQRFEWIDYRGGLLDRVLESTAPNLDDPEFQDLLTHICCSDALLVFLDSIVLTRTSHSTTAKRHSGASAIGAILKSVAQHFPKKSLNVVIVLTKADSDLLEPKWSADDFRQLRQLGRDILKDALTRSTASVPWTVGTVPVGSIGCGNVKSHITEEAKLKTQIGVTAKIVSDPRPLNIAEPLFYCLCHTFKAIERHAWLNVHHEEELIQEALQRSSLFARSFDVLTGHTDPKTIAEEAYKRKHLDYQTIAQVRQHVRDLCSIASRAVH